MKILCNNLETLKLTLSTNRSKMLAVATPVKRRDINGIKFHYNNVVKQI
jgi:hypothetical protein